MSMASFLQDPWVLLGLLILLVLCGFDFHSRIRRMISKSRFSIALVLFLALNTMIYLALVYLFLGAPDLLLAGAPQQGEASTLLPVIPLLVAFLYFGAGTGRWQILGLEIDIYDKLIVLANKALGFTIDQAEVRREIFKYEVEFNALRDSLKGLHATYDDADHGSAESKNLSEDWKAIEQDFTLIENHIKDLKEIRETLEAEHHIKAVELLQNRTAERENDLRKELIERVKTHLYSFIVVHAKTQKDVREMLESIPKASERWIEPDPIPLLDKPLPHCIMVGFFFGLLVGLLAAQFPGGDPYMTPWIASIACGVFSVIFYFVTKSTDTVKSGVIGAVAGFCGFMVWGGLRQLLEDPGSLGLAMLRELFEKSIVGVLYGGASAVIIHVFRVAVYPKIATPWKRTVIVGGSGAVVFFCIAALLTWLVPHRPQIEETGPGLYGMLLMSLIGGVFLIGLANACKLICRVKKRASLGAAVEAAGRG